MANPEFIRNWLGQARDRLIGLPLPVRLLMILIGVATTMLLSYVQVVRTRPEMMYILGGQELKAFQLQAACQVLDAEGLTGYQIDGMRIKVPRQQFQAYVSAIANRELGGNGFYAPFDKAAEQTSWLSSGAQDDRRWELAKAKSLAQSIEQMPEVESASVIIDRADRRGLRSDREARATVTVKPRAGKELPPFRVRQIRALVVGAVAGLQPEGVAVVDLNGRTLLELGADEFSSDDLLVRMKAFEEHYAWKIRSVLAYVPDVMVTVNVELDPTRPRRTEPLAHPAHEDAAAPDTHRSERDAVATVTANAATDLEMAEFPAGEPPPMQPTWEEHVALAPKSLTVSVSVPQEAVTAMLPGAGGPAEANNWAEPIRQRVASAIPTGVNATISVTSYPRAMNRPAAASADGASGDSRLPWTGAAIAMMVLASVVAWMLMRWQQTRQRRERGDPSAMRGGVRGVLHQHSAIARSQETRRELVRVERDVSRDGRGPHIIQASICGFEDLRWLAPASLQAVLGTVDSRLWAPALRGASRQLCDRILAHMPARAAALLRDEIEFPGPVRLGDVETAQHEILEIVRRLDHTGDLVLEDREEILHE